MTHSARYEQVDTASKGFAKQQLEVDWLSIIKEPANPVSQRLFSSLKEPAKPNAQPEPRDQPAISAKDSTNKIIPELVLHQKYSVQKGDTLSDIACRQLGKHASMREIYDYVNKLAQHNRIKNPDKIQIGQVIELPITRHSHRNENTKHDSSQSKTREQTKTEVLPKPDAQASPDAKSKIPVHPESQSNSNQAKEKADEPGVLTKAARVTGVLVDGIANQVMNHPGSLLKSAAIGLGVTVATAFLSPAILAGASAVGIAAGAFAIGKNFDRWVDAASVVANPTGHSERQQREARQVLHGVGEGIAEIAAGTVGGAVGALGRKVISQEIGRFAVTVKNEAKQVGAALEKAAGRGKQAMEDLTLIKAKAPHETRSSGESLLKQERQLVTRPDKQGSIRIEAPDEYIRHYKVNGREYHLTRQPGDAWYYGRIPRSEVGHVKVHVNTNSPEDLARLQKVLIPFLNENKAASRLVSAWKTFDPNHAIGKGMPPRFIPGPHGQEAKGFTIYTRTARDAAELQARIDRELVAKGLGLKKPLETGNVDIISGASNRVGTVRDYFPVTKDMHGRIGAKLDDGLARRIEMKYGGRLSDSQLREVERSTGIARDSLTYDSNGKLMLALKTVDKPKNGAIYLDESRAVKTAGSATDRPAMYALSRIFGWNPVDGL